MYLKVRQSNYVRKIFLLLFFMLDLTKNHKKSTMIHSVNIVLLPPLLFFIICHSKGFQFSFVYIFIFFKKKLNHHDFP